jgi:uncharacterized protein (DUF885 family)
MNRRMSPNDALADLADRYWDAWLAAHPTSGTALGERRYDDRLDPIGPEPDAARDRELRALQAELAALRPRLETDDDRLTAADLDSRLRADRDLLAADPHAYTVDALEGPQVGFMNLPTLQGFATAEERQAMVARWRAMPAWVDDLADQHRRGLREGRPVPRALVDRVVAELDDLMAQAPADWPLAKPARNGADAEFADAIRGAVDELRAAFGRYRTTLVDELRPAGRDDEHVGLMHLSGGAEIYAGLARAHTTIDLAPQALHELGRDEIERIDAEFVELGGRLIGTRDLPSTLARLRDDPALHFATRDEVFESALGTLERANDAIPDWFGRLPKARCEVVVMQPHEEKHSTIAYYREPASDGSRPGQYYVNASEPQTRPRYEAEALAVHEAVPGHHLQIAIAQELDHLPAFRRLWGSTAFVEGWGLYTERLADEMGLYSTEVDRFGILSFDAWRASRLVVDTGMHALGWSRGRAIAYMLEHTALAPNNVANEVDRYITWPGQALAYKVGQLELLRLRDEVQSRLGDAWDVRRFHDAVLGEGALPLGVLRESVTRQLGIAG